MYNEDFESGFTLTPTHFLTGLIFSHQMMLMTQMLIFHQIKTLLKNYLKVGRRAENI